MSNHSFISRLLGGADERMITPDRMQAIGARAAVAEAVEHSRQQPAPDSLSVVGAAVKGLGKARASYTARQAALTSEIDRLTEERRQVTVALSAVNQSLAVFANDPALTASEHAVIDDAVPVVLHAAEIAVDEE